MKKIEKLISLLRDGLSGNDHALESVATLLYDHVNSLSSSHLHACDTLLIQQFRESVQFDEFNLSKNERAHLFSIASKQIKRVLSEVSTHQRDEEKGNIANESIGNLAPELKQKVSEHKQTDFVSLGKYIQNLSEFDARKATLFELSYFGGMDYEEIAEIIAIPITAIDRELRFARAWICREISNANNEP